MMMIQVELSQADFGPSSSVLSAISEHCRYLVVSHLLLYETFCHFGALKSYFTRLDFLLKSQMGGYFGPERSGNVAGKHRHTHHYYHCLLLFVIIILIIYITEFGKIKASEMLVAPQISECFDLP